MPNHRFGPRTNARSQALQLLFQAEVNGRTVDDVLAGDYLLSDGPLDEFGERLARGASADRLTLDAIIDSTANNWKIERLPIVDRNLLRLALYEILEVPEVATAVAIDEYVELAKAYGTDDSRKFINGLLGRVARNIEDGVDVVAEAKAYAEAHPGFDDFDIYKPAEPPYDPREHNYDLYKGQLDPREEDGPEDDGYYDGYGRIGRDRDGSSWRDERSDRGDGRAARDRDGYSGGEDEADGDRRSRWSPEDDEYRYDDADGAVDGYGSLHNGDGDLASNDYDDGFDDDFQPFFSRRGEGDAE